jgi:hypothetical protein
LWSWIAQLFKYVTERPSLGQAEIKLRATPQLNLLRAYVHTYGN